MWPYQRSSFGPLNQEFHKHLDFSYHRLVEFLLIKHAVSAKKKWGHFGKIIFILKKRSFGKEWGRFGKKLGVLVGAF
jgi:hypothetical protein